MPKDSPELGTDWYSTDLFTDWGLKFVDEALAEKKPFFLYIAQGAVHFPLRAPAEAIEHYRGKYMVGWDQLREQRHARQIEMGIVEPVWPLSPRPDESPAWDSTPPTSSRAFDDIMADLRRHDRSRSIAAWAGWSRAWKSAGVLDNTLIVFLSDNGGNAESGPNGITEGEGADRRPAIARAVGHELGHARQHALSPLQAFHARRGHQLALHRPLARRHRRPSGAASWKSSRPI